MRLFVITYEIDGREREIVVNDEVVALHLLPKILERRVGSRWWVDIVNDEGAA